MALVAVVFIGMAYATRGTASAVSSRKGTLVCLVSGLLMGVFAPLITKPRRAAIRMHRCWSPSARSAHTPPRSS